MTPRIAQMLRNQGYVAPLTRELYAGLIKHRAPGTIPRGFTRQWLIENGIVDAEVAPAAGRSPPKVIDPLKVEDDDEEVAPGVMARARKNGAFVWYTLFHRETGEPIFARSFNGRARMEKALAEHLETVNAAEAPVDQESNGQSIEGEAA